MRKSNLLLKWTIIGVIVGCALVLISWLRILPTLMVEKFPLPIVAIAIFQILGIFMFAFLGFLVGLMIKKKNPILTGFVIGLLCAVFIAPWVSWIIIIIFCLLFECGWGILLPIMFITAILCFIIGGIIGYTIQKIKSVVV